MTLREFYNELDGNYAEVIERLKKEEMIVRFVKMFVEEDYLAKLKGAIMAGDTQTAFRAAHSLKGNCLNLGFSRLQKLAEAITEPLRNGQLKEALPILEPLEKEYKRTVDIVNMLENGCA